MNLAAELEARGFVHQFSAATLPEITDAEKRVVYHGIDPTADSAHVGNLVSWVLLRHLHEAGHTIIFLVGGGTGMIGDPKPDVERPLTSPEVVAERVEKIRAQAERVLGTSDITFVNNHEWLGNLNLIDFLRDTGKHFTVNELIKKEAIANRVASENGISYTEFAYPLLQAYDYLVLHEKYNCSLQIGGSDQWGNIVAGVDLVRKKTGKSVHALTIPLIVDKGTGKKFGKSEGNAVWLDPEKTSPYAFYQFWFNVSDESVLDYLKLFTPLSLDEITSIEHVFSTDPSRREAQKVLARSVTELVHGEEAANQIANVSELLFGDRQLSELSEVEINVLLQNAPVHTVAADALLVDELVASGLATSKREARMFMESGAVTVGDQKMTDITHQLQTEQFTKNLLIVRRGKKQLSIFQLM